MIRIAAVDDEQHVLERFARMVAGYEDVQLCGLFESGQQLIDFIKTESLDAVFLDIEMPGIGGLELSGQILDLSRDINIVFVTAFNQYAVEAFELQAIDYIMKPVTEARLEKTIRRLLKYAVVPAIATRPFIQCLGEFEVFVGGVPLSWKNSKAKEILAFLVHKQGVPVSWEKITDAVWPEYDREKAQTNFHATTYLLRKRLAEAGITKILESGRGNYRIVGDTVDCDYYQMEELLKVEQVKRTEDASLLERLEEFGYMEESGYAWAQARAARLSEKGQILLQNARKRGK